MTAWWQGDADVPRGYFTCDMCDRQSDRDEWMARCRTCGGRFCRHCAGPDEPESTEGGMVGECIDCVLYGNGVEL